MSRRILVYLVLSNLFWAGNYLFGKVVVVELSPIQMTFVRWAIAILFLFPMAHFIERPNWRLVLRSWKVMLGMSILGIVGYNLLLYQALRFTSPLNASLVNALNPAVIAIFSVILLKERLSKLNLLGFMISLFGVLLILTKGQLLQIFSIQYNPGDLLMVAAILVWTFYSILGRKIPHIPAISSTAVSVGMGLIIMFPFAMYSWNPIVGLSSTAMIGILYMGLFPTVGSFLLWNLAVRSIGPSRCGVFLNLITVFTAIASIMMGETISMIQVMGGLSVFAGVYLTNRRGGRVDLSSQEKAMDVS